MGRRANPEYAGSSYARRRGKIAEPSLLDRKTGAASSTYRDGSRSVFRPR